MPEKVRTVGWDDLDKFKYYTIGPSIYFGVRISLYPANLIKTRLQVQKGTGLYTGTYDAFRKILRYEGLRGLYKGFLVSSVSLGVGQIYITTYEIVRQKVSYKYCSDTTRSFIAGGSASFVAQSLSVPIDIVSQKLMVQGQQVAVVPHDSKRTAIMKTTKKETQLWKNVDLEDRRIDSSKPTNTIATNRYANGSVPMSTSSAATASAASATSGKGKSSSAGIHKPHQVRSISSVVRPNPPLKSATTIIQDIWRNYGVRGFYRGYLISLLTFGPSSAIWWGSYALYNDLLGAIVPPGSPHTLVQAVAGAAAGITSAISTNPVDVIRTRMQVLDTSSIVGTVKCLVKEEGLLGFSKGMTARIISMAPSSIIIIVSYETIKKLSLKKDKLEN